MPFVVGCPHCSARYQIGIDQVGAGQKCFQCGNSFILLPPAERQLAEESPSLDDPTLVAQSQQTAPASSSGDPGAGLPGASPSAVAFSGPVGRKRGLLQFDPWGVTAAFLGGLALVVAPWPGVSYLTIPLSLLGLAVGIFGFWQQPGQLKTKDGLCFALGGVVNVAVLLVVLFWPTWFGLLWVRGGTSAAAEDPQQLYLVSASGQKKIDDDQWSDASQVACKKAGVLVRVMKVTLAKVKTGGPGKESWTRELWLQVRLRVSNMAVDRRVTFVGWSTRPADAPQARLLDPAGHSFKRHSLPWSQDSAPIGQAILLPGKFAEDVLVFEPPAANVPNLRLELPADAWGNQGTYKFLVPRTMFWKTP